MDAFKVHRDLIEDYRAFTEGFVDVHDQRILEYLNKASADGAQWPDPWLSLNPSFEQGGSIEELVSAGILHPTAEMIFRPKKDQADKGTSGLMLHKHQRQAIETAREGKSYVLTTGTGSGKSLAYIVPIVDHVLRHGSGKGIQAIIVYPMNALANSQVEELNKFLKYGFDGPPPVTFKRYTGQESPEERAEILNNPPDILLTNYVMLELVLTRPNERLSLVTAAKGLRFLVLDELHTYRGRQGADVSMLVRRVREACDATTTLQCVGTSATMSNGGTLAHQRTDVAEVATRIFGTEVEPSSVITESLVRASVNLISDDSTLAPILIERGQTESSKVLLDASQLARDPLACWIEQEFGVYPEAGSGALVRKPPMTVKNASVILAGSAGVRAETAANAIRATLLAGSQAKNSAGRPFFAFRLHQFLSKGGSVFTTAESEKTREITTVFQLVLPGEPERRLYPLAFCRECGQDYLMVHRQATAEPALATARHQLRISEKGDGYLFVSDSLPWPLDPIAAGRLPGSWLAQGPSGVQVTKTRAGDVPARVGIAPDGMVRPLAVGEPAEGETLATWIPGMFRFCLRCGVSYEAVRTSEYTKLATLDREGRSSAMTVLATSIITSLKNLPDEELDLRARKLLTFVDNRQDASLQAGHLNDFVQVVQLRGAQYRALQRAQDGLDLLDIGAELFAALDLDPQDFLAAPDGLNRRASTRAMRNVLELRALVDLQRGWRVTLPNLEQSGLLVIEYPELETLASMDDRWAGAHPLLDQARPEQRHEVAKVMLDEFRRVLAIDAEALSLDNFERLKRESREYLSGLWAIGEMEPAPVVGFAIPEAGVKGGARSILTLTGRGAYGKWLRDKERFGQIINVDTANDVIASLLEVLERAGIVMKVAEQGAVGYRLKSSAVLLRHGDGTTGAPDPVRRRFETERRPRVISYFRDLYRNTSAELTGITAAEHTAQVPANVRMEREDAFRSGTLPLLFCSPTMELGVDIAALNAVAMRNVPPTPANYAQRSGRAGRSGQPAIVVTYCSSGNAHDSYYFERSHLMVAGQVIPPRLDLANEDLVRSHVHAIWLAEVLAPTKKGLGSSMRDVLSLAEPESRYPIAQSLRSMLENPEPAQRAAFAARDVLAPLEEELAASTWWSETWIDEVFAGAVASFDAACDRWRNLYSAARREQDTAFRQTTNIAASRKDREEAERRQREARQRIDLLLNDASDSGYSQSDFYTYRYLASEGFLPGYSFPRLPLAAFIPGWGNKTSSWLQRPRFLAITEFGPGSLIYHEGARYQVTRISLPRQEGGDGAGEVTLSEAKVCEACGTHHLEPKAFDVCESCGTTLPTAWKQLLQLQTVITRRRERISADEEERNRVGYEVRTTYRFVPKAAHSGKLTAHATSPEGDPILELAYGDSAEIRVTNLGRRTRKDVDRHGFWLDLIKGNWLSEKDATKSTDEDETDEFDMPRANDVKTKAIVTPYVEDRRNIAVVRWSDQLTEEQSVSLQFALERGIEARFQLEDSELVSELLPDSDARGRLLLTEAAEGGAGVLRRLQAEPRAIAEAATEALRIIHVDPETGEEVEGSCVRGCYRCLLSYSNQNMHEKIDRRVAVAFLLQLARSEMIADAAQLVEIPTEPTKPKSPLQAHEGADNDGLHTPIASGFLARLRDLGARLPSRYGDEVGGFLVDFVYDQGDRAVVVVQDGVDDINAAPLVFDGWNVVTVAAGAEFDAVIAANESVFGKVTP